MDFGLLLSFRNPPPGRVPFTEIYRKHFDIAALAEDNSGCADQGLARAREKTWDVIVAQMEELVEEAERRNEWAQTPLRRAA